MSIVHIRYGTNPHDHTTRDMIRDMVRNGLTIKQMMRLCHRSEGTVKIHVRYLLRELGCANRKEAIVKLKENGNG